MTYKKNFIAKDLYTKKKIQNKNFGLESIKTISNHGELFNKRSNAIVVRHIILSFLYLLCIEHFRFYLFVYMFDSYYVGFLIF